MPSTCYNITFTGRVQGVNFRWTACQVAKRFNVAGWVRNEVDGSVRCLAEGDPGDLDAFVKAVQDAMSGCIKETRVSRASTSGELSGFTIQY